MHFSKPIYREKGVNLDKLLDILNLTGFSIALGLHTGILITILKSII